MYEGVCEGVRVIERNGGAFEMAGGLCTPALSQVTSLGRNSA